MVDSIRDELDIRRVIADYCLFVDDGDFRRLLECFTTDAEFIFAGRSRVGHDVLLRFFEATGAPEQRGKHMVANTVIDVDAGGVTARSMSDFVFYGRSAGGFAPLLVGRYLDDLRRDGGRWRLARRQAVTL